MASHPVDPMDRPLPPDDALNVELRLMLAPRQNPADDPRPSANGDVDEAAVGRIRRMLRNLLG